MTSVTITKLDGGYTVEWYFDALFNQPMPPGYQNKKIFVSLDDALNHAKKMLKDREE